MSNISREKRESGQLPPAEESTGYASQEVKISYSPQVPRTSSNREIHPRRPLPFIPEGECVPDENPSPPVNIEFED